MNRKMDMEGYGYEIIEMDDNQEMEDDTENDTSMLTSYSIDSSMCTSLETTDLDLSSPEKPPQQQDHDAVRRTSTLPFHGTDLINSHKLPRKKESIPQSPVKEIPALHQAIKENQIEKVKTLLQQPDINCNEVDSYSKTPLHYLAECNHTQICDEVDNNGNTPPVYSAECNHTEICDLLLQNEEIDINKIGKTYDSPLCHAIKNGHMNICEKLIDNNAIKIDLMNRKKKTAVHIAVENSKPDILKLLLSKGAKRDTKDHYFRTPLYYCMDHSDYAKKECFSLLLDHDIGNDKINVDGEDKNGDSALHVAIRTGSEFMVERILNLNANPNVQNKDNMTPVLEAAKRGSMKILKMLKLKNGNFEQLNKENKGVLHLFTLSKSQMGISYILDNLDIDVNIKDKKGKTALHYAIEEYKPGFAHKLVIAGTYCKTDGDGNNPIHIAAKKGMSSIVEQLCSQARNSIGKQNKNMETPLHIAVKKDYANICRILVKKKAKFDISDKDDKTALQLAVEKNCEQTVQEIVNNAGEKEISNSSNKTILHIAAQKGSLNCCEILIKKEKNLCWLKDNEKKLPLEKAFMLRHEQVFALLLKNMSSEDKIKEDIHIKDFFGTALGENRRIMVEAIIDSIWWEIALLSSGNRYFKELIRKYPKLAKNAMDKCIIDEKVNHVQNTDEVDTCVVNPGKKDTQKVYNLQIIEDIGHKDIKQAINPEWMADHPLMLMVKHKRLELLQHSLTNNWLIYTWGHFTWIILTFLLALHITDAVLLTIYMNYSWSWVQFQTNVSQDIVLKICNNASNHENIEGVPTTNVTVYALLWINIVLFTSNEALGMYKLQLKYPCTNSMMNLVHIILTVILLLPLPNVCNDHAVLQKYQFISGILTLLLAWLLFMTTLNRFPSLQSFNPINSAFLLSFTRVLIYLGILLFAFAFIFHLLLQHHAPFSSFAQSIMKTVVWMLGDLAYDDLFINDNTDNITIKVLSNVVFCIFIATLGGFITNLAMSRPLESLDDIKDTPAYRNASLIMWFLRLEVKFEFLRELIRNRRMNIFDGKYRPNEKFAKLKNIFSWITVDIKDKNLYESESTKEKREYMSSLTEIKYMLQEQKETNLKLMEEITYMKDKMRMISNS